MIMIGIAQNTVTLRAAGWLAQRLNIIVRFVFFCWDQGITVIRPNSQQLGHHRRQNS
jgi:hypothetical protein